MRVARGLGVSSEYGEERAWDRIKPEMGNEDISNSPNSPAPKEVEEMKNKRPENRLGYGSRMNVSPSRNGVKH